jgi:hypothetical protein
MISALELAWLAGLLEGEGTFIAATAKYPVYLSLNMTDADVVRRVATWWRVAVSHPRVQQPHHKPSFRCMVRGQRAVDWMRRLQPFMGERRTCAIDAAIRSHVVKGPAEKISAKQAAEIAKRHAAGERAVELAAEFKISKWQVSAIKQGRRKLG